MVLGLPLAVTSPTLAHLRFEFNVCKQAQSLHEPQCEAHYYETAATVAAAAAAPSFHEQLPLVELQPTTAHFTVQRAKQSSSTYLNIYKRI